jgi:homocysteine S-methyltransferase
MQRLEPERLMRLRVLDGGFASELERLGVSVDGPLWSARALEEAPEAVIAVHRSYLEAGADVLLTGSYQVSAMGFHAAGCSTEEAAQRAATALRQSVALARKACVAPAYPATGHAGAVPERHRMPQHRLMRWQQIVVAASLGPYGAALANGAEFTGKYGFADPAREHATLVAFHAERIAVLAETDADLLAFETVPSLREALAIVEALHRWPQVSAWISFTCRDGEHTAHGERLRVCAEALSGAEQVVALGVNCTAPQFLLSLLAELRAGTAKPLLVYPNSGEAWDAVGRCWVPAAGAFNRAAETEAFGTLAQAWFAAGAQLVGGCCRTGPEHVRAVAAISHHS